MSPSRTTFSACSLAAKLKNLDRLILPIGSNSALRRAGAIGERGSTPILSSGRRRRSGGSRRHKAHESRHTPCETTMATVENTRETQQKSVNREGAEPLIHERPLATVTAKLALPPRPPPTPIQRRAQVVAVPRRSPVPGSGAAYVSQAHGDKR